MTSSKGNKITDSFTFLEWFLITMVLMRKVHQFFGVRGLNLVQRATKKEKTTPTVSPNIVFPQKSEKGRIAYKPDNVDMNVCTSMLSLFNRKKLKIKNWSKHQSTELQPLSR